MASLGLHHRPGIGSIWPVRWLFYSLCQPAVPADRRHSGRHRLKISAEGAVNHRPGNFHYIFLPPRRPGVVVLACPGIQHRYERVR